ncbi:MAG TPA: hypothetical protein DDY77_03925, partial [Clostridiales bacterium]|nr:hypothetical protein [Clostridiales bacterium]
MKSLKIKSVFCTAVLAVAFAILGLTTSLTSVFATDSVNAKAYLSLGEEIVLKTNLTDIPDGYNAATMSFTLGEDTERVEATVTNNSAYFEYKGITPNYFSSEVAMSYTLTGDGQTTLEKSLENFSVDGYAAKLLDLYPDDEELKQLVVDMYAYGEALKTYAEKGNTALTSVQEYGLNPSEFTSIENPNVKNVNGTSDKLTWKNAYLYFDYKVNLAFSFSGTFAGEPILKVKKENGEEQTVEELEKIEIGGKTTYRGVYRSINLSEYDVKVTAIVYDGEEKVEKTVDYSLASAVYAFQSETDGTYKQVVRRVYNYGLSAVSYSTHTLSVKKTDGEVETYRLKVGEALPQDCIDENAIGYYNQDDVTEFGAIKDFIMPRKNYNLAFYYKDETTEQRIIPGSFKTGDYGLKAMGVGAIVDGVRGTLMTFSGAADEYFRFVSVCGTSATALGIQAGRTYRFDYILVNYGKTSISFKLIGVQTKTEMTTDKGAVISNSVTLESGEKITVSMTITLTQNNTNAMTCLVLEEACVDAKLGVNMTKTNADAEEHTHTVTIDSSVNATFENGEKSTILEWGSALPTVVFETTTEVGGWYDVADLSVNFVGANAFVMPDKDITVAPLKKVEGTYLDFGYETDYAKNITCAQSTRVSTIVDGLKGHEVTLTPTAKGSCSIRFKSKFSTSKSVSGMTFYYTIE